MYVSTYHSQGLSVYTQSTLLIKQSIRVTIFSNSMYIEHSESKLAVAGILTDVNKCNPFTGWDSQPGANWTLSLLLLAAVCIIPLPMQVQGHDLLLGTVSWWATQICQLARCNRSIYVWFISIHADGNRGGTKHTKRRGLTWTSHIIISMLILSNAQLLF